MMYSLKNKEGILIIKNKNIRVVIEDSIIGADKAIKSEKSYGAGYDDFPYPYTVSFYGEGEYKVVIKGKTARVEKIW